MRRFLIIVLLLSAVAVAKDRNWKDAIFMGTKAAGSGAAAMPIGTMIVAVPLSRVTYGFKSEGVIYVARTSHGITWANLTVNGHTKIAVEGRNLHVLDEDNKDRTFNLIEKVAEKAE